MRSVTRQLNERTAFFGFNLLLLLLLMPIAAQAQEAPFTVTVEDKTSDHPFEGQGFDEGFVIDGNQGAELTLERGVTYLFIMDGVPSIHPFYITESEVGAGAPAYSEGVTNNFASGTDTLTFTPPEDAPELLYYQCQTHRRMGYQINIVEGTPVEGDARLPEAFQLQGNHPNPFNPTTTIRFDLPQAAVVHAEVFDVLGRRQLTTPARRFAAGSERSLAVDASTLPSGTYLYRITARTGQGTQVKTGKMVLLE